MHTSTRRRDRTSAAGPRHRHRSRGQSLAEFVLVVPVLLMIVLFALDLGRLFYSYVTITNAARVAANYAGSNPYEQWGSGSQYSERVMDEGLARLGGFCTVPGSVPAPAFRDNVIDPNGTTKDLGDKASVTIACDFRLVTPIVASFFGDGIDLEATATFPIRQGAVPQ